MTEQNHGKMDFLTNVNRVSAQADEKPLCSPIHSTILNLYSVISAICECFVKASFFFH